LLSTGTDSNNQPGGGLENKVVDTGWVGFGALWGRADRLTRRRARLGIWLGHGSRKGQAAMRGEIGLRWKRWTERDDTGADE